MVVLGAKAVTAENARELLGRTSRPRVDDRRAPRTALEPLDEGREPIVGVRDPLDVVAQVRTHDARVDDLERASERLPDVPRRLGRRGRGQPEERRVAERLEAPADEEVVGPEVVSPHAHAVHLVDDDEPDADLGEKLDEARLPQALRRRVDETGVAPLRRRPGAPSSPRWRATS